MLFQRFEASGLAAYSYMIGDGSQALVIDPQRDCDVYLETAARAGMQITHILETHRNEDYVIGSVELAARTGAQVLHSAHDELPYGYGGRIADGATVTVGALRVRAIHTPGHTLGHMSYLLLDPSGAPWMLFSGDALFAGDVGRTDFYGADKLEEMCGLLYESIVYKMLPLGDGVLLCAGHGTGSACGTAIADRPWTTIGLERTLNPMLKFTDKARFIGKCARMLDVPPYFRRMEQMNLVGPRVLGALPVPRPLAAIEFQSLMPRSVVVDTRSELGFSGGHVPGATYVWEEGLPGWAGWFVPLDVPILLVSERDDVSPVVRKLIRMGYEDFAGYLSGGMISWHKAGLATERLPTVTPAELRQQLSGDPQPWVLDVRAASEVQATAFPGAHHIHLTHLSQHLEDIPRDRPVVVVCASGIRSTLAASVLRRAGYHQVTVLLGGMAAWGAAGTGVR